MQHSRNMYCYLILFGSMFHVFFFIIPRNAGNGNGWGRVIALAMSICPSVSQLYKFEKMYSRRIDVVVPLHFYMNKGKQRQKNYVHDIYTILI